MPDPREATDALLKQHGCVLLRAHKHQVWQLPNGQKFTRASTPGDPRSDTNALQQLKATLGIQGERGEAGERRTRKKKRKAQRPFLAAIVPYVEPDRYATLREKLMAIGRPRLKKYEECLPIHKQVVLETPLTVILRRLFP